MLAAKMSANFPSPAMAGSGRPWLALAGLGLLAKDVQHCSGKHMAENYWPEKCWQISQANILKNLAGKYVRKFGRKMLENLCRQTVGQFCTNVFWKIWLENVLENLAGKCWPDRADIFWQLFRADFFAC